MESVTETSADRMFSTSNAPASAPDSQALPSILQSIPWDAQTRELVVRPLPFAVNCEDAYPLLTAGAEYSFWLDSAREESPMSVASYVGVVPAQLSPLRVDSARAAAESGAEDPFAQLEAALATLDELATADRVRAIGVTGLDYFRTGEEGKEAQHHSFREHIRLAKKHNLALQIHDRDAHEDVVRILDEEGAPERTVFHCYSGGPELAEICNERGWYMSFAGTVTFKNSKGIQESLAMARPELILAETDAPFLTPHPFRGRPNASYMTNYTVRFMAAHRGEELEALCRRIRENSERVYGQW